MAGTEMSVAPYWELTFDADGDVDGRRRDRLTAEVAARGVRHLVVFAHGWNTDRSGATRLFSRFLAPFPELAPRAGLGFAGVVWPSMRFSDEPIPDFPHSVAAPPGRRPALDEVTLEALRETFPGQAQVVDQIARLLTQQPHGQAELEGFGRLVRLLVGAVPSGPQALFAADTLVDGVPQDGPAMFHRPVAEVCREFTEALAGLEEGGGGEGFSLPNPWHGARELLRQATYYAMKRRAGVVGERGLGPVLGRLAEAGPGVRVHLVGHSFGARLVSFALRGLPEGVRTVKSVTLLQGAFSHYAFASRLPHDPRAGGVLRGRQNRVDGPVVCCHSRYDSALGTLYPMASRMAGDAAGVTAEEFRIGRLPGARWGAMGYDGVQAVPGTRAVALAEAVRGTLPASGCVNVDAASVVRRGGPPSGAHSDILHRELAQVVVAAGRIAP
ncbi:MULTISPECIES: serine-threonine protein kinase [unclassified Streptomyces]|uniref:serine-threonine protein kinase n=1 Tax=unclassified Streptomyces TaxID=2593676 RepID=UPI001F03B1F9|nr:MULTISPECIES: serine-threonine protein kinase [unclassified Streptomyces]MCH0565555.1 serine-threonine protein kinase [Streptomyces sp. MUM 2J]MCH0569775.1 serine-threonine protein kinase [Streptomyces sp. MUM 136J]